MKRFMLIFMLLFVFVCRPYAVLADTPDVMAQGAILIDYKTGRVLWQKNADVPMAMASTTKIMTAIMAIELGNLDDTVKVSRNAAIAPPVKMHLQTDEEIKLSALLHALMLQSSNDAAVAIAEHIGGSVAEFCRMMDEKAKEIGCEDTHFETPNGLDAGDHHSTAEDMAKIARYALANETFIKITNTPNITVKSNIKTYDVINKNRLLNEYAGANGIKTGYTGKAGQCFVGAAKRNDMQLISVVLASGWGTKGKEQKWKDTKEILNYGFDNFKYIVLVDSVEPAGDLSIERSKTTNMSVYYVEDCELPLSGDEADSIEIKLILPDSVKAPVYEGQVVGLAEIYISNELYKEIDVYASGNADRHDLKTSLEKVLNEFIRMGTRGKAEIILPEF